MIMAVSLDFLRRGISRFQFRNLNICQRLMKRKERILFNLTGTGTLFDETDTVRIS